MEWKIFNMKFIMKWNIFSMEWKKISGMEYGIIVFHSILYYAWHLPPPHTARLWI